MTRADLGMGRGAFVGDQSRIESAAFNIFLAMQECIDRWSTASKNRLARRAGQNPAVTPR